MLFFTPMLVGRAKYLRRILQASVLRPFARISYGLYLIHGLTLMWYLFGRKQITAFTYQVFIYTYLSTLTLTLILSFPFVLLFEGPFRTLNKLIFFPKYHQDRTLWVSEDWKIMDHMSIDKWRKVGFSKDLFKINSSQALESSEDLSSL